MNTGSNREGEDIDMGMNQNRYEGGSEPIRRYRRKGGQASLKSGIAIAMTVLIVFGAVLYIMSVTGTGLFRDPTATPGTTPGTSSGTAEGTEAPTATDSQTEPPSTEPGTAEDPSVIQYRTLDKKPEDSGSGLLVLVDADHIYRFPGVSMVPLIGNLKAGCQIGTAHSYTTEEGTVKEDLMLRSDTIDQINRMIAQYVADTGFDKTIITDAYRSFDYQKALSAGSSGAASPGSSDYHTGATFMLSAYAGGKIYSLSNLTDAKASWFTEHMHEYGFVFRYPSDKKSVTGYNIPWQIRYVGVPHATYMKANNLCLEEYLNLLAEKHLYAAEHLTVDCADGMRYEIFYVEGAAEGVVKVPVPQNREYLISGDNKGGFIVTVEVGQTADTAA